MLSASLYMHAEDGSVASVYVRTYVRTCTEYTHMHVLLDTCVKHQLFADALHVFDQFSSSS